MADFCIECYEDMFGSTDNDLNGLCEPGQKITALCEGCGSIHVDHTGKRVGPAQLLQHQCGGWMELDTKAEIGSSSPPQYVYECRSCNERVWR